MIDRIARLRTLLDALDLDSTGPGPILAERAGTVLAAGGDDEVWLALAVLRGRLPLADDVVRTRRSLRLAPPRTAIAELFSHASRGDVAVLRGAVVVDVHHTARTRLATGIQRVVRETIRRWHETEDIVLAGWTGNGDALRALTAAESENARLGTQPGAKPPSGRKIVIPWKSTYLLAELATDDRRTLRIAALAEFSGNRTGVVGYDCVPLTTAETIGVGMGSAFARYLTAVARMDAVASISVAALVEYSGWRAMLPSAGMPGPRIQEIILPGESGEVTEDGLARALDLRLRPDLPLVLCVGSHEPRKNHLSVIQAAELLWARGREFEVLFVGGNSWDSQAFELELARLRAAGAPISTVSGVADAALWGLYRLADVTVFPSYNEGFGLPVAESLTAGTPVVTSAFGSMRELGQAGGAILVDPRDDDSIASGIESVLFEPGVGDRLRDEAAELPRRSWDDYASELWDYFEEALLSDASR